jgi:hypothetical protein
MATKSRTRPEERDQGRGPRALGQSFELDRSHDLKSNIQVSFVMGPMVVRGAGQKNKQVEAFDSSPKRLDLRQIRMMPPSLWSRQG